MQCTVCKIEDDLSNLVLGKSQSSPSSILSGYAHQRCIDQHNKMAAKNLRALDASMTASEISGYDIDATDPGAVERFFCDRRQKVSRQRVNEIVAAAEKSCERDHQRWLFARIEEEITPGEPAEATDAFITKIAEDLKEFSRKGEDACHFAARLLVLMVVQRKFDEAFDAACEDYERSEAEA